jgi:hypothetical protein
VAKFSVQAIKERKKLFNSDATCLIETSRNFFYFFLFLQHGDFNCYPNNNGAAVYPA